jgi:hypothetical protein
MQLDVRVGDSNLLTPRFTRGWTLQEFIAPDNVRFYDCDWRYRGSKQSLSTMLSRITGIDKDTLWHLRSLDSICVAQKMSWASSRMTTRIEDAAYSLLGIFGVNLPLLYGEEERAFVRLQEEIIRTCSDLSILAWTDSTLEYRRKESSDIHCAVLAESPADFSAAGPIHGLRNTGSVGEFSVTNRGMKLYSPINLMWDEDSKKNSYVLPLHCRSASGANLGIRLRKIGDERFLRQNPWSLVEYNQVHVALGPRFIYLALDTQDGRFAIDTQESLRYARNYVLTWHSRAPMEVLEYWGIYDHHDQTFFDISEDPRNWIAFHFLIGLREENMRGVLGGEIPASEFTFNCTLYITGWTSDKEQDMQYYLVETDKHTQALASIEREFVAWEAGGRSAERRLDRLGIPKSCPVQISMLKMTAHIYVNPKRVTNAAFHRRPFWDFEICGYLEKDAPEQNRHVSLYRRKYISGARPIWLGSPNPNSKYQPS